MCIRDRGKVVDVCAEPGEYIYDISTEPSLFAGGNLSSNIKQVFQTIGKRFTFGGVASKDQRVYYFNTKELVGNKYGTPSPVPFRVVDEAAGIDLDIAIRCFGEYSYRITNPLLFYTNLCGNVEAAYTRDKIDSQLKAELLTALQPAFAKISAMGIRYSALPGHTMEIAQALNDVLSAKWRDPVSYTHLDVYKRQIWKEKKLKFGNKMNFYTHEAQQILLDDSLFDLPYFTGCQAGNGVCCIKANGDILPCVLLDIPIGNIRENSFSTIWLNSPILEELNNRQKYSEPCVQCIYVEKCGGCRGVAYGSFGDYFAPDPHCWLDSNGERL